MKQAYDVTLQLVHIEETNTYTILKETSTGKTRWLKNFTDNKDAYEWLTNHVKKYESSGFTAFGNGTGLYYRLVQDNA